MRWLKIASPLLLFALTGLMTSCESEQQTAQVEDDYVQQETLARPGDEYTPQDMGWQKGHSTPDLIWSSMYYPTGDQNTSALSVQRTLPREVRVNEPFEYDIIVTNLTDQNLQEVMLTEELGENMKVKARTVDEPNLKEDMKIMGPATQKEFFVEDETSMMLGALGPGETRMVHVTGVAYREGTVDSCITVSHSPQLCSVVPVVKPNLVLIPSIPDEIMLCDDIPLRHTVSNTGTGTIHNVFVNCELPDGLQLPNGQRTITLGLPSLAAGQSHEFETIVNATTTGRIMLSANATGDGNLRVEPEPLETTIRQPMLELSMLAPERRYIGRTVTHELTVTNNGDAIARNVIIENMLPTGEMFKRADNNGRLSGNMVQWNIGDLQPNASRTVKVTLMVNQPGTIQSMANVRGNCADPVTATAETNYEGIAAILLEVVDIDDPVEVGGNGTYLITVTNQGTAKDTNIRVVATLEEGHNYVSSRGPTLGMARGNIITFEPIPTLAPNEEISIRILVNHTQTGYHRIKVDMSSDQMPKPVLETEATNIY